jgi:quinol-cytochrome oxidoreductase complex cytochrome b subunit
LNWNDTIRQLHRWLSIAFTLAVIVNLIAMSRMQPALWVGLLALVPLILLLFTGLYMFALPYVARSRSPQRSGG